MKTSNKLLIAAFVVTAIITIALNLILKNEITELNNLNEKTESKSVQISIKNNNKLDTIYIQTTDSIIINDTIE
jgi:hypothetical protein